jgi:hypothetical protein
MFISFKEKSDSFSPIQTKPGRNVINLVSPVVYEFL